MFGRSSTARFTGRVLIVAAVAIGLVAAWKLREAEFLLFGAILGAILLRTLAAEVRRWSHAPAGWSLAITAIGLVALVLAAGAYFGVRLEAQVSDLIRRFPAALLKFRADLRASPLGPEIGQAVDALSAQVSRTWPTRLSAYAAGAGLAIADAALVGAAAIYIAAQPSLYVAGALRLLPRAQRDRGRRVLEVCGVFLGRWIAAQLIAMATVGALWALGLWLLGVPAPAALGAFAALAEFVPMVGPMIAAVPALLMALTGGETLVLWTLGLYVLIHVAESNLLQPLLQRGLTSLPPVFNLFALVVFWVFFGLIGVVFATPVALVASLLVEMLYLGEDPEPPPWAIRLRWSRSARAEDA